MHQAEAPFETLMSYATPMSCILLPNVPSLVMKDAGDFIPNLQSSKGPALSVSEFLVQ